MVQPFKKRLQPRLVGAARNGKVNHEPSRPEQRVDLPAPVPVYIVYLTAQPSPNGRITDYPDIYRRDG